MNITVIGAGKSGMSAALLAAGKGNRVFLSESADRGKFKAQIQILEENSIVFEFGGNTDEAIKNTDLIVTSPGVPPTTAIIQNAEKKGIPVISELEYAYRFVNNKIIAITGTNGKTTTTYLAAHILNKSGKKARVAGNVGTPLSDLTDVDSDEIFVVETSSYQLDRITRFRPDVAVILNITPDHLGYHGSMKKYIEAKWKISSKQSAENLLILNADDSILGKGDKSPAAEIQWFSAHQPARGIYMAEGRMIFNLQRKEELMFTAELSLPGLHNAYNSMAAALAARAFEISNEDLRDSLMSFQGVEHRLEFVRNVGGVNYINDSKATNINAAWYALSSYNQPLIWIAGGRGDSNDYSQLEDVVKEHVKYIICIGEEADNIFNFFCAEKRCFKEESLEAAVARTKKVAMHGEYVLFSPACKSFDMYINYEQRGDVFKEIVNSLKE